MHCPTCQKRAISFLQWGHGINAFRWQCNHCGQPLKATRATWLLFIFLLLLVPFVILAAVWVGRQWQAGEPLQRVIFGAISLPIIIVISFVHWYFGRYDPRE